MGGGEADYHVRVDVPPVGRDDLDAGIVKRFAQTGERQIADLQAKKAKIDQLEYVSRFVDCIEINSTFYRPPFERTVRSWLERTKKRAAFFFTAKLHRSFTHEGKIEREIVKHFHKGFEPLLAAGKLRHLLAQFRYDFADSPENRRLLEEIVKRGEAEHRAKAAGAGKGRPTPPAVSRS